MGTTTKIQWCDSTRSPWTVRTPVSEARRRGWSAEWGAGVPRHRFTTFEAGVMALARKAAVGRFCECGVCGWRGYLRDAAKGNGYGCCECWREGEMHAKLLRRARPRVFPSLCDWLDPEVPAEWLADLLDVIRRTPSLDWLLVTKRPGLWRERIDAAGEWMRATRPGDAGGGAHDLTQGWIHAWGHGVHPVNVWIGATCEDQRTADERIPALLRIPAARRFVSVDPMLGPVDLTAINHTVSPGYFGDAFGASHLPGTPSECAALPEYPRIHWVICGGESGAHARPMHPEWPRSLRDQCVAAGVPFTFRVGAKRAGRLLDGRTWDGRMLSGKDGGR